MVIAADGTLSIAGGSGATSDPGVIASGQTYFFVWKVEDGGTSNDLLTLYLNPMDLSGEGANSSTLQVSGGNFFVANNTSYSVQDIRFASSITDGNQFIVDEFRIGTTWEDVAPFSIVPEPASALLAASGTLALLRRRRDSARGDG